jgi:hypothetical protein
LPVWPATSNLSVVYRVRRWLQPRAPNPHSSQPLGELEASGIRCRRLTSTAPRPCVFHGPLRNPAARICAISMASAPTLSIGKTYIHNGSCLASTDYFPAGFYITFRLVTLESRIDQCRSRHVLVHRRLLVQDRRRLVERPYFASLVPLLRSGYGQYNRAGVQSPGLLFIKYFYMGSISRSKKNMESILWGTLFKHDNLVLG